MRTDLMERQSEDKATYKNVRSTTSVRLSILNNPKHQKEKELHFIVVDSNQGYKSPRIMTSKLCEKILLTA